MDVPDETETYKDPTPGSTLLRAQYKSNEHVRFFNSMVTDIFTTKTPTAESILQLKGLFNYCYLFIYLFNLFNNFPYRINNMES